MLSSAAGRLSRRKWTAPRCSRLAAVAAVLSWSDDPGGLHGALPRGTLVFHDGRELPGFAVFPLLEDEAGGERLRRYFDT